MSQLALLVVTAAPLELAAGVAAIWDVLLVDGCVDGWVVGVVATVADVAAADAPAATVVVPVVAAPPARPAVRTANPPRLAARVAWRARLAACRRRRLGRSAVSSLMPDSIRPAPESGVGEALEAPKKFLSPRSYPGAVQRRQ
jgi:hypothetical protein